MPFCCTLASGSDGNCVLVSHAGTHLLIDAGVSAKRIRAALFNFGLDLEDIRAVLVTHEHSDHTCGLKVLRREVYAAPMTALDLRRQLPSLTVHDIESDEFDIGSINIRAFKTPHDTPDSRGFFLRLGEKSVCICTDLGHVTNIIREMAAKADYLLIESNHDEQMLWNGSYPMMLKKRILGPRGHLSNVHSAEASAAAVKSGASRVTLCHLSKENNLPEIAEQTARERYAQDGIGKHDVELDVAPHGVPGKPWGRIL